MRSYMIVRSHVAPDENVQYDFIIVSTFDWFDATGLNSVMFRPISAVMFMPRDATGLDLHQEDGQMVIFSHSTLFGGTHGRNSATKGRQGTGCRVRGGGVPLARRVFERTEEVAARLRSSGGQRFQRSDAATRKNLRLDIKESETRLSTGRKGASPPMPPLARPLPHHEGQNTLYGGNAAHSAMHRGNAYTTTSGWLERRWLSGGTNLLPHPALPRPERDEPARSHLMRCAH